MSRHRGTGEHTPLTGRLDALNQARELAEERLPEESLRSVYEVLERAAGRRSLSGEHTVVGFFGATGSGKSSLFNAVTGRELAGVAARRPTTSEPLAAVWEEDGSEPLLDWLDIRRRHILDAPGPGNGGLILLDLPDFDSTAVEHREIVERMAGQVDVLVWVLDPQKYADAAVHHGFLKPMASHGAVTLVVLNQVDRLPEQSVQPVLTSLQGILALDGLTKVKVLPVSAVTGEGVNSLRAAIGEVVSRREAMSGRLNADVTRAAAELEAASGSGTPTGVTRESRRRLASELAQAAGVELVASAVAKSYRHQAHARTGWPVTRWLGKLRPDPLRRLNLHRTDTDPTVNRSSLPQPGPSQRAQSESAVRAFADAAATGAPEAWRGSIRRAARLSGPKLADATDQAIVSADLGARKGSWWWPLIGILQWLLLATAVAGLLWLTALFAAEYFQFQLPEAPRVEGFPVPTLLVAAGLLGGVVVAVFASVLAAVTSRVRADKARRRLTAAIADVAERLVVAPVQAELERFASFGVALKRAKGEESWRSRARAQLTGR